MFVTCLYGVLDPDTGRLPLRQRRPQPARTSRRRRRGRASCARAACRSGLMPGMSYEEKEAVLAARRRSCCSTPTASTEAHDPDARDVRHSRALEPCVADAPGGGELIDRAARRAARASPGADAEQEDDITLVTLAPQRAPTPSRRTVLAEFERRRARRATSARRSSASSAARRPARASSRRRLERLKTAVGEATMNAMEHGNGYRRRPARCTSRVLERDGAVRVRITDQGGARAIAERRGARPRGEARPASRRRAAGASS